MKADGIDHIRASEARGASPRVAVIGAGIAGLSCARELASFGFEPVVFEASERLGGRCSSQATPAGCFDDGAQCISGPTRLASYVAPRPDEFAPLHAWTVPSRPRDDALIGKNVSSHEDDEEPSRILKLMGTVGVPSMLALANAIARTIEIRLCTPIEYACRRQGRWLLRYERGDIDEDFQALILALPAPLAAPLAQASPRLAAALQAVRYNNRWVLLLGSERPLGMPGYREFQGSPIERIAAMHSKPGRRADLPQRWFIEADEQWSRRHAHSDAETVADLLLDNFRAQLGRPVMPSFLRAQHWKNAYVHAPAAAPGLANCLWDGNARLGVCGDSVVVSRVDHVHRSGVELAQTVAMALNARCRPAIEPAGRLRPASALVGANAVL